MPPFPTAAATSEGADPLERSKLEQGGAALGSTESRQTTRRRDATLGALCIYCGPALEDCVGDSEVGHLCYLRSRRVCARQLHAGPCGTPRVWAHRPAAMRFVAL